MMVVQSKCYVVLKINDSMEMMTYEIKLTKNIYTYRVIQFFHLNNAT